MCEVRVSELKV